MAILVPYLLSAVAIPMTLLILFVSFSFQYPLTCAALFGLFIVYKHWFYSKSPQEVKSSWLIPDPVSCLRTGDVIVDELVQGGALPRVHAKYGSIVQIIKEKIRQSENQPIEDSPEGEKQRRHVQLFKQLIAQIERVPEWVDEKKLERASQLYRDNVVLISAGLAVALVESYAFPIDAEVLFISGGLTTSASGTVRRLMETGLWVFSIMKEAVKVGNPEWSAVVNVRFLHAFARKKCLESTKWRAVSVPVDEKASREDQLKEIVKGRIEGEMPINQATMCATLFLFCQVVMEVAEMRGAKLSDEDKECYWHYWRYCGYLLGVEESVMPKTYVDGLVARQSPLYIGRQKPNKESQILSKDTIESYSNLPHIPFQLGPYLVTLRKFLGDKLCDELGAPKATLAHHVAWHFGKEFFKYCYVLNNLVPPVGQVFTTSFVRYISNAYLHYFVLDKMDSQEKKEEKAKSKCPFGF